MNGGYRSINIAARLSQVHEFRHRSRRRCWRCATDANSGSGSGRNCAVFINIHAVGSCRAHHSTMQEKVANQQIFALFEEKVPLARLALHAYAHMNVRTYTHAQHSTHTRTRTAEMLTVMKKRRAHFSHATLQISRVPTVQLRVHKAFALYSTCFTQLSARAL